MKKNFAVIFLTLLFVLTGIVARNEMVYAQDSAVDVELSEIMTTDALVGYTNTQTRGMYLAQGFSVINDAGGGKIGCGGTTVAAMKCKVSVNSVVERQVNGNWVRVTSWTSSNASAYSVSISKTLAVGSGYYYRVRCLHYAGTDASSSCTDSMWM